MSFSNMQLTKNYDIIIITNKQKIIKIMSFLNMQLIKNMTS